MGGTVINYPPPMGSPRARPYCDHPSTFATLIYEFRRFLCLRNFRGRHNALKVRFVAAVSSSPRAGRYSYSPPLSAKRYGHASRITFPQLIIIIIILVRRRRRGNKKWLAVAVCCLIANDDISAAATVDREHF